MDQNQFAVDNLSADSINFIKSLNKEKSLVVGGKKLYFVHYPWDNDGDVIDDMQKSLQARQLAFNNIDADYIFFAHEHEQCLLQDDKKTYYTVNTLGLDVTAKYCIVTINNQNITIEEKSVQTNLEKEVELVKQRYPDNVGKKALLEFVNWVKILGRIGE